MTAAGFGKFLLKARQQAGLSQAALASKCKITQSYLNRLETSGAEPPGRDLCRRIALALDTDGSELWKQAFISRAKRWLLKEGYTQVEVKRLLDLLESLENRRGSST